MPGHADAIGFALTFVRTEKFLRFKKNPTKLFQHQSPGNDFQS